MTYDRLAPDSVSPASTRIAGVFARLQPSVSAHTATFTSAGQVLTTHLLQLSLVKLVALPGIAFNLLGIRLPLSQEANLDKPPSQHSRIPSRRLAIRPRQTTTDRVPSYQMHRIIHSAMGPKLGFDVLVTQDAHLCWEVLAVRAQQPAVKRDGRQKCGRIGLDHAVAVRSC